MTKNPKVISIEFNELCPGLMDKFIKQGDLPNFKRLRAGSEVYTTTTEATGEDLNPWVQWVTVHTGADYRTHDVKFLSEGHKLNIPAVWDVISDSGNKVWVCGSMNPRANRPIDGYLLPDPWSVGETPQPANEFDTFYDFVQAQVQNRTNADGQEPSKARFIQFMVKHGLSISTAVALGSQILGEKFSDTHWKRAMLLDRIQFDLFKFYYRKSNPAYSSFFVNSTAHYQHSYWRHMDPAPFTDPLDPKEEATYKHAILEGYKNMDGIIAQFMRLSDEDTTLIFSTGLSQQPFTSVEGHGGRRYFHVKDRHVIEGKLGVSQPYRFEPVMAEQFFLRFDSAEQAKAAEAMLTSLEISEESATSGGTRMMNVTNNGDSLLCQCRCINPVSADAIIKSPSLEPVLFYDVFYEADTRKSGKHHPDGMLWLHGPGHEHKVHEQKLPLRELAPIVLDKFGLKLPPLPSTVPAR